MTLHPAVRTRLAERAARFEEITELINRPEVAASGRKLTTLLQERGALESVHTLHARISALDTRRAEAARILADPAADTEFAELAREDAAAAEAEAAQLESAVLEALVREPADDRRKVIVEIRAGVGGDEATLFARDLYGIYRKYCDTQRWKFEDLEVSTSDVGGFKEVVFAVEGEDAWRKLRFESGGHRVQRVPATEAQGRIHTSAATVAVMSEESEVEIAFPPEDLRIDTMRAGGAGGQHVNKTESAVRITHLPTGIVAICQDGRSQGKNRASAMRMLQARVLAHHQEKVDRERAAARKSQVGSGDRSERIRTYNWPQNRVTDHRANENFSLEQILSGKLDPLFEALVAIDREERIRAL
ncbi:MAG: peptide chain release factor 1 [Planctomycetota bacterium]|nr:peptide chain release factor 1 [Planctomycetota bacterium]